MGVVERLPDAAQTPSAYLQIGDGGFGRTADCQLAVIACERVSKPCS